jgi:hypothetical protein
VLPAWLVPPPPSDLYKHWQAQHQLSDVAIAQAMQRIEHAGAPRIHVMLIDAANDAEAVSFTHESIDAQHYPHHQVSVISGESIDCRSVEQGHCQPAMPIGSNSPMRATCCIQRRLLLLAERVATQSHLRAIYFDEDTHTRGTFESPIFKPDFNLDMLRSYPYAGRALAFKRERCIALGGLSENYGDLAGYDLCSACWKPTDCMPSGTLAKCCIAPHCPTCNGWRRRQPRRIAPPSSHITCNAWVCRTRWNRAHCPASIAWCTSMIGNRSCPSSCRPRTSSLFSMVCSTVCCRKRPTLNYELLIVDNNTEEPAARAYLDGIERAQQQSAAPVALSASLQLFGDQ